MMYRAASLSLLLTVMASTAYGQAGAGQTSLPSGVAYKQTVTSRGITLDVYTYTNPTTHVTTEIYVDPKTKAIAGAGRPDPNIVPGENLSSVGAASTAQTAPTGGTGGPPSAGTPPPATSGRATGAAAPPSTGGVSPGAVIAGGVSAVPVTPSIGGSSSGTQSSGNPSLATGGSATGAAAPPLSGGLSPSAAAAGAAAGPGFFYVSPFAQPAQTQPPGNGSASGTPAPTISLGSATGATAVANVRSGPTPEERFARFVLGPPRKIISMADASNLPINTVAINWKNDDGTTNTSTVAPNGGPVTTQYADGTVSTLDPDGGATFTRRRADGTYFTMHFTAEDVSGFTAALQPPQSFQNNTATPVPATPAPSSPSPATVPTGETGLFMLESDTSPWDGLSKSYLEGELGTGLLITEPSAMSDDFADALRLEPQPVLPSSASGLLFSDISPAVTSSQLGTTIFAQPVSSTPAVGDNGTTAFPIGLPSTVPSYLNFTPGNITIGSLIPTPTASDNPNESITTNYLGLNYTPGASPTGPVTLTAGTQSPTGNNLGAGVLVVNPMGSFVPTEVTLQNMFDVTLSATVNPRSSILILNTPSDSAVNAATIDGNVTFGGGIFGFPSGPTGGGSSGGTSPGTGGSVSVSNPVMIEVVNKTATAQATNGLDVSGSSFFEVATQGLVGQPGTSGPLTVIGNLSSLNGTAFITANMAAGSSMTFNLDSLSGPFLLNTTLAQITVVTSGMATIGTGPGGIAILTGPITTLTYTVSALASTSSAPYFNVSVPASGGSPQLEAIPQFTVSPGASSPAVTTASGASKAAVTFSSVTKGTRPTLAEAMSGATNGQHFRAAGLGKPHEHHVHGS